MPRTFLYILVVALIAMQVGCAASASRPPRPDLVATESAEPTIAPPADATATVEPRVDPTLAPTATVAQPEPTTLASPLAVSPPPPTAGAYPAPYFGPVSGTRRLRHTPHRRGALAHDRAPRHRPRHAAHSRDPAVVPAGLYQGAGRSLVVDGEPYYLWG